MQIGREGSANFDFVRCLRFGIFAVVQFGENPLVLRRFLHSLNLLRFNHDF